MIETPIPYDESQIKDKFWKEEPFDKCLPEKGFLTDFVLATRGIETPTLLSFWSAVWTLSSALKRDAFFKWFPDPLYPNFFIILVAPPALCRKSTAVRQFGEKILIAFTKYYEDPKIRFVKEINLLRKATPEAMEKALEPIEGEIITVGKKTIKMSRGSQVAIVVSELSTFLGKQKYNEGLISKLIDLYDCKDDDSSATIKRGSLVFKNIYVTLIGATTISGLNESIPEVAMEGGFISRVILVHAPRPTRAYPEPRPVIGGPTRKELSKRLAWIANNAQGEYYFSPEAKKHYDKFYYKHRKSLLKGEKDDVELKSRYDLHLRKLALILRAQEYREGNEISLDILKKAQLILEETYKDAQGITKDVGVSLYTKTYMRVKDLLLERGKITRRQLIQRLSPSGVSADMILKVMEQIHQAGLITISLRGKKRKVPSTIGEELYTWDK
jgi:hypothetical protein